MRRKRRNNKSIEKGRRKNNKTLDGFNIPTNNVFL
jgi:hypothetical protein